MLTRQDKDRQTTIMASYLRESFDHLTRDYVYKLKAGYPALGIRYLHYYERDHTLLASNITNARVHLLNISTGNFRSFLNHSATVRKIRVFNGEIYTSSWDGSVRATNYHTLQEKMRLTERSMGRCPFFNISPDGRYLYSFTYDSDVIPLGVANSVRKWDLRTGKLQMIVAASTEQKSYRKSGSIIFYENRLYVSCNSGFFRIFDLNSGRLIKEMSTSADFRSMTAMFHHQYLLASDWDGYIHFLNLKTNRFDHMVKCHNTDILCMRLHPRNPDIIFTSSSDGVIKVWKMPGFILLNTILVDSSDLWSMVFINDHLLTGNIDGEIRVYDINDLSNIRYKGRIVLSDRSFVAQATGSRMFYTNDISAMEVYKEPDAVVSGKESEYLLDQGNNLMALRELLGVEDTLNGLPSGKHHFMPLLAASFKQ